MFPLLMLYMGIVGYVAMALQSVGLNQVEAVRACIVLFISGYTAFVMVVLLRPRTHKAFLEFSIGTLAATAVSAILVATQVWSLTPWHLLVLVLASGLAAAFGRALTRQKGGPTLSQQVNGWQSLAAHNERAADAMERSKADAYVVNTFKAAALEARGVALVLEQERRRRSTGTP